MSISATIKNGCKPGSATFYQWILVGISYTFVKIDMIQVKKEPKYSILPGLGSNSCKSGINIGELYKLYTHTWDKYCIYFTWTTKINIDSRNMGSTPAKWAAKSVKGKQNWKYVNKIVNGCRFDWWQNGGQRSY